MCCPCPSDRYERTGPSSARSASAVLSSMLLLLCSRHHHADTDSSEPGGGYLRFMRISSPLPSLSENIMSQDRIRSRKKTTTTAPGGYHDLKPTIWVGKQGMTETIIEEIRSQIKTRKIIKVKWLESTGLDPEVVASESGTVLLQVRGRTMVLGDAGSSPGTRSRNI